MSSTTPSRTLALRSLVTSDQELRLSLDEVDVPVPGPDEVVVRMEAAAINPSDLGLLFANADLSQARRDGARTLIAPLSAAAARANAARTGQSLGVGNEGAGTVIAAGSAAGAQALVGKTVGIIGGDAYSQLRTVGAAFVQPFPDGTSADDGAGWFVNPMTASVMLATMRAEGHRALVHTAAASALGRMLVRLTAADGVALINIVRRPEQLAELRELGAEYVCDSSADSFRTDLEAAIEATGATLAFDAVGGGTLADQILGAMERTFAAGRPFDRYGTAVHKQVYIYGSLDFAPTPLRRGYGMSWGVGGWLVGRRLQQLGAETSRSLQARVAAELRTTFATRFGERISLSDALDPEVARLYGRPATNVKYLIDPTLAIA